MTVISLATGRIEYFEWGPHDAAHCILVLHAAATSARAYANFAARLVAAGVRVVAPSLQHYGNTTLNVPGDYVAQHVSVANACLEHVIGNAAVTVFGHSMGGLTALKLALSCHRALRLVLYEPIVMACLNEQIAGHREALAWDRDAVATLRSHTEHGDAERGLAAFIHAWNEMVWIDLSDAVRAALIEQAPRLVEETHCVTYQAFDCTRLQHLNQPTLLLSGRRSPTVAQLVVSELARQISSATHVQLEDAGHMGPILTPRSIAALVESFAKDSAT